MTDPAPLDLAEIRRALDAATPGPWDYGMTGMWSMTVDNAEADSYSFGEATVMDCCPVCEMEHNVPKEADRDLIVNAPTWLAALLDRVEALDALLANAPAWLAALLDRVEALDALLTEARECEGLQSWAEDLCERIDIAQGRAGLTMEEGGGS